MKSGEHWQKNNTAQIWLIVNLTDWAICENGTPSKEGVKIRLIEFDEKFLMSEEHKLLITIFGEQKIEDEYEEVMSRQEFLQKFTKIYE